MAIARAKGKLKGKQPKLTARQQVHLVEQHATGEPGLLQSRRDLVKRQVSVCVTG